MPHLSSSLNGDLKVECDVVMRGLQTSMRDLLASAPVPIQRATELQRFLGVRVSLAWQIVRMTRAETTLGAIRFVPLSDAMRRFLGVARRTGLSGRAADAAERAFVEFERLVARHAGDRESFAAMVKGLERGGGEGTDGEDRDDLASRRAAFRAQAKFWGIQARMIYRCMVISGPASDPKSASVIIQGMQGLRALKAGRSLPVCRRTITVTLDADAGEHTLRPRGTTLLEEFCSERMPALTTRVHGTVAHDYLTLEQVGKTAEVDLFLSTTLPSVLDDHEQSFGLTTMVRVPSEEFVADLVVPTGSMDVGSSVVRVTGCLEDVSAAETGEAQYQVQPLQAGAYLGRDIDALHSPAFARCPELIRHVLRSVGAGRSSFDVFRCIVRFPMLHTCVGFDVRRAQ